MQRETTTEGSNRKQASAWRARACAALVLAALIAPAGCGSESPGDLMRYIPVEATTVVRLDAKRLRGTELDRRIQQFIKRNDFFRWKIEDLAKQTGVEVFRHIDTVILALPASTDKGPEDFALVVGGKFDRSRVVGWYKEYVKTAGAEPRERAYGRHTIYYGKDEGYHVAFMSSRTLLVGTKAWIGKMLDLADGKGAGVEKRQEMQALLARVQSSRILSAVMYLSDAQRTALAQAGAGDASLASMTSLVGDLDSSRGVELAVVIDHTTPEAAKGVAESFAKTLKEIRGSALVAKAGLSGVAEKLVGTAQGREFRLTAELAPAQLDELVHGIQNFAQMQMAEQLKVPGAAGGRGGRAPFGPVQPLLPPAGGQPQR
ncbi:MAG TPA: hypothetical protein VGQ83_01440 [Polyangia bacterium]|jgi:hypothetical protein